MFEQQHILKENQIVSTFLLKFLDLTVSIVEKSSKNLLIRKELWQKQSLVPATYTKYIFTHSYSIFISKYKPRNQIKKNAPFFRRESAHLISNFFSRGTDRLKYFKYFVEFDINSRQIGLRSNDIFNISFHVIQERLFITESLIIPLSND